MEQRRGEYRMDGVDRALSYTVLTDVLRQWLVIFCFAVSAALLAAAVMQWHYQPSYTSQATLYVTKRDFRIMSMTMKVRHRLWQSILNRF